MKHIRRPSNAILKEALYTFGYILPYNKDFSSFEFAVMIANHSSNNKAHALALELKDCKWHVNRGRCQLTLFLKNIDQDLIREK